MAACDNKGEWRLPLMDEDVQRMKEAMDKRSRQLGEPLLAAAFASMRKVPVHLPPECRAVTRSPGSSSALRAPLVAWAPFLSTLSPYLVAWALSVPFWRWVPLPRRPADALFVACWQKAADAIHGRLPTLRRASRPAGHG